MGSDARSSDGDIGITGIDMDTGSGDFRASALDPLFGPYEGFLQKGSPSSPKTSDPGGESGFSGSRDLDKAPAAACGS